MQLDLFNADDVPPFIRARRSDPETSHEAASSLTHLRARQAAVLALLRLHGPRTLEELVRDYHKSRHTKQSDSGIRTRCSELVFAGLVEDSGERRKTKAGRNAVVWRAVPEPRMSQPVS